MCARGQHGHEDTWSMHGYYSFHKTGLLEELKLSKKWVPRYIEEERIRKEVLKIGEKVGLKGGEPLVAAGGRFDRKFKSRLGLTVTLFFVKISYGIKVENRNSIFLL